ncbi:hypothetical protein PTB13_20275, partial [Bacillus sp. MHSD17]|nr:hypothetical protein [Bacillus sp. MHSD17]
CRSVSQGVAAYICLPKTALGLRLIYTLKVLSSFFKEPKNDSTWTIMKSQELQFFLFFFFSFIILKFFFGEVVIIFI